MGEACGKSRQFRDSLAAIAFEQPGSCSADVLRSNTQNSEGSAGPKPLSDGGPASSGCPPGRMWVDGDGVGGAGGRPSERKSQQSPYSIVGEFGFLVSTTSRRDNLMGHMQQRHRAYWDRPNSGFIAVSPPQNNV